EPPAALTLQVAQVLRALLVYLPVHAGRALVVNLHAIHPAIAPARQRILREDERHGDAAPAVFGPALDDGQVEQREFAFLQDALFARAVLDRLRKHLADVGQTRHHLELIDQALRRFDVGQLDDAPGNLTVIFHTKRQVHALAAAERVDEYGDVRAARVFKQQRRAAALRDAVGNFADLKLRVDFGANALQQAALFERRDKFPQVLIGHNQSVLDWIQNRERSTHNQ